MTYQIVIKSTLIIFFLSFFITLFFVPFMISFSKIVNAMDKPDKRKVHKIEKGRLGGVAIYLGVMLSLIPFAIYFKIYIFPYVAGSLIIFFIGIIDDIYGMKPIVKLFGQLTAALVLLKLGIKVEVISGFEKGTFISLGNLKVPLTILWIVTMINMINFLDGLDGLASGMTVITALTLIFVNICDKLSIISVFMLAAIAGASLGFLKYNWFPARIFMGDTGSMFLGFSIGVASILGAFKGATLTIVIVPFIVLLIPIYDMIFAIIRRISNDRPIFKPDKEHIHHQFLKLGFRHDRVVILICSISSILGLLAILLSAIKSIYAVFYMIGLAIIFAILLVLFFKFTKPCDNSHRT